MVTPNQLLLHLNCKLKGKCGGKNIEYEILKWKHKEAHQWQPLVKCYCLINSLTLLHI